MQSVGAAAPLALAEVVARGCVADMLGLELVPKMTTLNRYLFLTAVLLAGESERRGCTRYFLVNFISRQGLDSHILLAFL